ncbi:MAG: ABC-2 family transporter protein [Chloroflexota bacterium]
MSWSTFSQIFRHRRKYLSVMENSLQEIAEYRLNFVLSFAYTLIPLASFILLWLAIYASQTSTSATIGDYSLSDMITYYILATWVNELNASERYIWRPSADINTGRLSLLLLRPLDSISYYFFIDLAATLPYSLMGIGLIAGFVVLLRIDLVHPNSFWTFSLFVIAVILGYLLSFIIGILRAIPTFWLENTSGFNQLLDWVIMIFSGSLIPLSVLPPSLQHLSLWLPFQYLVFFPVNIYLGQVPLLEALQGLIIELIWLIASFVGLRLAWRYGLRRYTAIGG